MTLPNQASVQVYNVGKEERGEIWEFKEEVTEFARVFICVNVLKVVRKYQSDTSNSSRCRRAALNTEYYRPSAVPRPQRPHPLG